MELPSDTPADVVAAAAAGPRVPQFDSTLGISVAPSVGSARHRLVAIGDSLSQGFQSGAVFNTDLSYPAIIAYQLGWFDQFRFPRYGGPGGLPLNIELLLRTLEERFGTTTDLWEIPLALFAARGFMDQVEDHWERGPGSFAPTFSAINHNLSVYGWDLRDALTKTAASCEAAMHQPHDDVLSQIVENNGERAALRVLPRGTDAEKHMTAFDAAAELGKEGIETLIVFLGANNALRTVTELRVQWSGNNFRDQDAKRDYTVWQPSHFASEYADVLTAIRRISAQHVILCTVPHVTIAPIARGLGGKVETGSRYFPFYARPWVRDEDFDPRRDQHITGAQAWAVDTAIDLYNKGIEQAVASARRVGKDWHLFDIAGLLERVASRRYIADVNARPSWWTPYPMPKAITDLAPVPDSRFLSADGRGGRASGGLFSLDGVHPTTVAYGVLAQELVKIMSLAGVQFDSETVDFDRLVRRDTLVRTPPQNLDDTLGLIGWADEHLGLLKRIFGL
ncbi:hypothetical protein [Rhodococcus sp. ARC_M6]|uniref:hypothetical protein n=1 Tax=Rhodococcus sp. ARC_M6 TaxID=2928852 RepID=UPI001FB438BA|nr:hypothetical protein [Rhodococcus sp. ARC_M6]MCJ0902112.1 hypothetical protein [Rhodococcus sp. ARC_M6]